MRLVRAEMLEVLRTDYIKFARARGLTTRAIHFGHALKNTLVPVITVAGLQFGSVVAFAIITETVFQWPGMGLLFMQAVQNVDIPIMAAYLMMVVADLRRPSIWWSTCSTPSSIRACARPISRKA
jgi:peptide/nickel transport system permease protein